ncbi:MAG: hypothetical protein GX770_07625 [Firmicutes bacterium]|nr:hypothetical protein [Bacillota bacterium]
MSALYPYPAIQYIPLAFQVIYQQESSPSRPFILIGREIFAHQEALAENFGAQLPVLKENTDQLLLVVGGFEPLEVKYRGFYVTIKVVPSPLVSLISLPRGYFYKETLVFQAKTADGNLLAAKAFNLPLLRRRVSRLTY